MQKKESCITEKMAINFSLLKSILLEQSKHVSLENKSSIHIWAEREKHGRNKYNTQKNHLHADTYAGG